MADSGKKGKQILYRKIISPSWYLQLELKGVFSPGWGYQSELMILATVGVPFNLSNTNRTKDTGAEGFTAPRQKIAIGPAASVPVQIATETNAQICPEQ
jgi:hypothetical protein